ncbi:hypothetical protein LTR62_000449 [Meristemomyces frigidus]|uniref:Inosine/uridine-preferring nucleoside hydrolase domain-containing protein n=1 Tax=Meristemomyces frigidus TaxID=1508187 RepID=A0AAN7YIQ2_9PEZI|nr:hypothetical protein LTR62_000449 [Meristemomyces frigidus]
MSPRKIIIDTDPGVDDILAMLLAFSTLPEELEILLISVTYGNIDLTNCLRNVVSLFHHIEQEIRWRESQGREAGFETLRKTKPLVAIGPDHPLRDDKLMADFFHGTDGLGGIHDSHPHLAPGEAWKELFEDAQAKENQDPDNLAVAEVLSKNEPMFAPSKIPAHLEILRLLRENDADTISIVAIGPLTNLAIAAAEDTETFLRAKEVVVMGGTIDLPGNVRIPTVPSLVLPPKVSEPAFRLTRAAPGPIRNMLNGKNQMTPVAEFNTFADSYAAARVYALTSPTPKTTLPPIPPTSHGSTQGTSPPPFLAPYPENLSRRLNVKLFPLDITERHLLTRGEFTKAVDPLLKAHSPLAEWVSAFLTSTFNKVESLQQNVSGDAVPLQLHDPLCIWYCMSALDPKWNLTQNEDIRVETSGQWTRGMCVTDGRSRRVLDYDGVEERAGDSGNWLSRKAGNRMQRCMGTPGEERFGGYMLERIFKS